MFHLFGKKGSADPQSRIQLALEKQDYAELAQAYYDMGVSAMDGGDAARAMLWLSRADTVYSAADELYSEADKKRLFRPRMTEDCSDRIGTLEEAPLLVNEIIREIEEKVEEMSDAPVRVWSLLTLARLEGVCKKLSALPGCEVLAGLGCFLDLTVKSFQEAITREEFEELKDACSTLYEFSDSPSFFAGGEVPCAGPAPIQVFDLNGMTTLLNLEGFLDGQLRHLTGDGPDDDGSLIPCALLPDYWLRVTEGEIRELPQVKAELERIWADCAFVSSGPSWGAVAERIAAYRALGILSV